MATIDQKSGVFAGLAAEEIPAAGSLALGKPKNFVAMQWGTGTPPPVITLCDGLVSWWTMDEATEAQAVRYDDVGFNYLTAEDGPISQVPAKINDGAFLSGLNNNYLEKIDPHRILGTTETFSFGGWVRPDETSDVVGAATLGYGTTAADTDWLLWVNGAGNWEVRIGGGGVIEDLTFGAASLGVFAFVVMTYDPASKSVTLYVDGVSQGTQQHTNDSQHVNDRLLIGKYGAAIDFTGIVDEMFYYSRVLSSTDVTDLFNGGTGLTYFDLPCAVYQITARMMAWWDFDEASGDFLDLVDINNWRNPSPIGSFTPTPFDYQASPLVSSGFACSTDANNDMASLANRNNLVGTDRDFSIACWIRIPATSADLPSIVWCGSSAQAGGGANESWTIKIGSNGQIGFTANVGATYQTIYEGTILDIDTDYFIYGCHDAVNSRVGISLNGGAIQWRSLPGTINSGLNYPTTLGRPQDYLPNAFNGSIDSMGFWDRLLSTDDIDWLYNGGSGRVGADLLALIDS